MNVTLKNRQVQIPNGLRFEIPEIAFKAAPFQSFDTLVASVLRVVRANPALAKNKGWPDTKAGVELWVDRANALICLSNGWHDYIITQRDLDPPKFPPPPGAHPAEAVAAGAISLAEWFGGGMKPVPGRQAEGRAAVCAKCEFNREGDLGNWFSRSVSELIRNQVGRFKGLNLTTSLDAKLGVCDICECPMKLKVHVPVKHIENNMPASSWANLPNHCWVKREVLDVLSPAKG